MFTIPDVLISVEVQQNQWGKWPWSNLSRWTPEGSKLAIEWKGPWNFGDLFHINNSRAICFLHGCFLDFQGELYSLLSSSLHPYDWQTEVETLAMTIWKVVLSLRWFSMVSHTQEAGPVNNSIHHRLPPLQNLQTIQKLSWVFFGTIVTRTLFWPLLL